MKELIFLLAFPAAVAAGTFLANTFKPVREAAFVLLVFGTTQPYMLDINFLSREWYRGTTRGIELSWLDILTFIVLFSGIATRRREGRPLYVPASLLLMLVYFFYCVTNVLINEPKLFGVFELSKIVRGITVFVAAAWFVRGRRELTLIAWGLSAAMTYEAGAALYDRYIEGRHRVPGTLDHPNSLSLYSCMAAPMLFCLGMANVPQWIRLWCAGASVLAMGCVVLSISRTGFATLFVVMAGAGAACMTLTITPKKLAGVALAGMLAMGLLYKSWDSVASRLLGEDLEEEFDTSTTRGRAMYFSLARLISSDHVFGVGLNNWSYAVSNDYGLLIGMPYLAYTGTDVAPPVEGKETWQAQAGPAHNLALLTLGELGWPGLMLFGAVWVQWFRMCGSFLWKRPPDLTSRFGLGAFFALSANFLQSLTEYIFRHTAMFFLLHIILGAAASIYYHRRRRSG